MANVLAIETSSRVGSIALARDRQILGQRQFEHGLQNAARLVVHLDELMKHAALTPGEIDLIYVSAGPGSFTGLRIGVTLAKTLAFVTGAPIVAVPTMRVLAHNAPADSRHLIIVLDAKRDQVFTARYERTGKSWEEREPAHLDRLDAMLARSPRPVVLLGEGIPFHQKFIPADDAAIDVAAPDFWIPRAAALIEEGAKLVAGGCFTDPDQLAPVYLRKPEAQEKWEQTHGNVSS